MAYAAASDIATEIQRTLDGSSVPTSTQALAICTEISNEIDGILSGLGYSVPVPSSATVAYSILKTMTVLGSSARVERIAAANNAGSFEYARQLGSEYESRRKDMAMGRIDLVDATVGTDTPTTAAKARPSANFPKETDGSYSDPRFKDDMKF